MYLQGFRPGLLCLAALLTDGNIPAGRLLSDHSPGLARIGSRHYPVREGHSSIAMPSVPANDVQYVSGYRSDGIGCYLANRRASHNASLIVMRG